MPPEPHHRHEPFALLAAFLGALLGAGVGVLVFAGVQTWALANPPAPAAITQHCLAARARALDPETPAAARVLARAEFQRWHCRAFLAGELL